MPTCCSYVITPCCQAAEIHCPAHGYDDVLAMVANASVETFHHDARSTNGTTKKTAAQTSCAATSSSKQLKTRRGGAYRRRHHYNLTGCFAINPTMRKVSWPVGHGIARAGTHCAGRSGTMPHRMIKIRQLGRPDMCASVEKNHAADDRALMHSEWKLWPQQSCRTCPNAITNERMARASSNPYQVHMNFENPQNLFIYDCICIYE